MSRIKMPDGDYAGDCPNCGSPLTERVHEDDEEFEIYLVCYECNYEETLYHEDKKKKNDSKKKM